MSTPLPRLIVISHPRLGDDNLVGRVAEVSAVLPPGALIVQLRDKTRDSTSLAMLALRLRQVTTQHGQILMVNGDATAAREAGADGVHLGGGAGSVAEARKVVGRPIWVSVAAHTDDDVRGALEQGADAVLVSPIFTTPGKGTPRGLAALESAAAITQGRMALYALGGVDRVNSALCLRAGADGVAVVGAVLAAADPAAEARSLFAAMQGAVLRPVRKPA